MEGSARTPTLTALLCLGLCQGPWNRVQAGSPLKPSIWADPGPMVTKGSPVTIWCQGSLQTDVYHLYKERVSKPLDTQAPQDSSNKTSFSIEFMSSHTAGLYQCAYNTSRNDSSERSDALPLVVTGVYSAPSLSAHPGPVVASGENVSLSCSSEAPLDTFHLLKEGGADLPRHMELRTYHGRWQAVFPVGPVNTSHGGTYRCYGSPRSYPYVWSHPSDPLHLEVTGVYREPSLSAQPGSLVLSGHSLTLQCCSEAGFDRFALTKDEGLTPPQRLHRQHNPYFPLGHVNHTHGGQYRCYSGHNLSSAWSAPSAPLDILIAGTYDKPSLSAQPGPSVPSGENVTLQCRSEIWLDTFHLSKEGSLAPPQHLHLQDTAAPFQANFTISPVTSDHEGTYKCYGSNSTAPYLLSLPSDPLELLVSRGTEDGLSPTESGPQGGLEWYLKALIGVSAAFILLLSILLLLFLIRHRRQGKHKTSDAAVKDTRPEEGVELDHLQGPQDEDPQRVTYAQVNHSRSRLRQGVATSPSPVRGITGREGHTSRRGQTDGQTGGSHCLLDPRLTPTPTACLSATLPLLQAAASEDPQDVTYAQLNHWTLRRETTPPSSQSE
ncbi:leukocyte immunoglobulin-like receptor subfamily A member 6 isoform X3 [Diceros bicornis minor]|uniref:leukocyte immunoglobulin-like receptor subfamily A member 6 isoform X3 n=1 Tax=Diceros bicornis minor TaxID=77932 RepID=UPI0026EC663D|nr:leukocyte immunoglobulin-like receptor subfamily A member 6 isoform X3 [Diceros bicornis minor]